MKIRQILLVLFIIFCIPACRNKEEPPAEALQEETGEQELSEAENEEPAFTVGAQTWHSEDPEIPADANVLCRPAV